MVTSLARPSAVVGNRGVSRLVDGISDDERVSLDIRSVDDISVYCLPVEDPSVNCLSVEAPPVLNCLDVDCLSVVGLSDEVL